jgi:hypothetical protein
MMFLTTIRSSATSHLTRSIRGKRFLRIHVQLDYHPSSQYAGMHLALKQELYLKRGLEVILVKPGKHGGDEPKVVLDKQAEFDISAQSESISIGIVEQMSSSLLSATMSMFEHSRVSFRLHPLSSLDSLGQHLTLLGTSRV